MPKKFNINFVVRMQHWMDSVPGQTFLNYAYSWGASIVILGALFKLTHLPGGNFMLFIGMGTEVVVFFLSAFDRPFDKGEIGKELPHDYETDEEIAAHLGLEPEDDDTDDDTTIGTPQLNESNPAPTAQTPASNGTQSTQSGVVIIGATQTPATAAQPQTPTPQQAAQATPQQGQTTQQAATATLAQAAISATAQPGTQPFDQEAKRLAEIIRLANDELLRRAQAALSPEMEEATQQYIAKLRTLADTFQKVDEQSARLALDSEEMAQLGRTLTAINKTYDLHFKSISTQVGTIEQINEQTRSLARRIEELNAVYGRMIQALTVNIGIQPGANPTAPHNPQPQP